MAEETEAWSGIEKRGVIGWGGVGRRAIFSYHLLHR